MASNANGKRPMGGGDRGQSKRPRETGSFSPQPYQPGPSNADTPTPIGRGPDMIPEIKPDIGMKAFLDTYLATHTASDPLFRRSITTLVEDRFDYEGIDYADQLLDDIKAKGGHHPDIRAVQTVSDEELGYKWARLMMSVALEAGNLSTIMRYLGTIAADRFGVHLNENFETAVESFLIQVGHTPMDATRASVQRQMSVLHVDDKNHDRSTEEEGGSENQVADNSGSDTSCVKFNCCTCEHVVEGRNKLKSTLTRKERLKLFKSPTPILDMILGKRIELDTSYILMSRQRKKIVDALRTRAKGIKGHNLKVSKLLVQDDPWIGELVRVQKRKGPADARRQQVERHLDAFFEANHCLFPELRRFDLKERRHQGTGQVRETEGEAGQAEHSRPPVKRERA